MLSPLAATAALPASALPPAPPPPQLEPLRQSESTCTRPEQACKISAAPKVAIADSCHRERCACNPIIVSTSANLVATHSAVRAGASPPRENNYTASYA